MPAKTKKAAKAKPVPWVVRLEGHWFVYDVQSISEPARPRRVDIEAYNWNGDCDCPRMKFKRGELERGAKPDDKMRCSHIKAARSFALDEVMPMLAAALGGKKPPEKPLAEETPAHILNKIKTLINGLAGHPRLAPKDRLSNLMAVRGAVLAQSDAIEETINERKTHAA